MACGLTFETDTTIPFTNESGNWKMPVWKRAFPSALHQTPSPNARLLANHLEVMECQQRRQPLPRLLYTRT
jgi:hypothetical protein